MSRTGKVVAASLFALSLYLAAEAFLPPSSQPTAKLSLALIHGYQATGSKAMESGGIHCRYRPTCSHYAEDAITYYGTLDGVLRTAGRLWRCSPWGGSGYDPAVDSHPAAYFAPQETEEQRKERERVAAEQIRRVQENLSKPADKAAMDELNRAIREGMKNSGKNQAGAPQNETDEQRQKREQEEVKQLGRDAAKACLPGTLMCVFGILTMVVYLVVKIVIMIWAFKDAKARGDQNAILWPILIFFLTPIIGLVIYLVARPKGDFSPCGSCHQKRLPTLTKCPHCGVDSAAPPPPPKA